MSDLLDEFAEQAAAATRRDLAGTGAPWEWLWSGAARVGVTAIEPRGATLYEPSESGELAYVVPACPLDSWDAENDLADLIAWRPSRPEKWWTRCAAAPILNPAAVRRAEALREPLTLHATPAEWLQAAGEGAVILDWRAHLRLLFCGIDRVVADSDELADAVERRLREPAVRMPLVRARAA